MPLFVTIEGIEGAGKSTLRADLSERVRTLGREVVVTREPGATTLGQSVRSLVLDPRQSTLDPLAELMLFSADRAQHLAEIIRPALGRDAVVICDRYVHSTLAYQGYGRGLPLADLRQLCMFVTSDLLPDLVILLDLPAEEGLRRAAQRTRRASGVIDVRAVREGATSDDWNRFEEQDRDFHERVRDGFLMLAAGDPKRFLVIDASAPADVIAERAFEAVRNRLGASGAE